MLNIKSTPTYAIYTYLQKIHNVKLVFTSTIPGRDQT